MTSETKYRVQKAALAISGGPDSVYLYEILRKDRNGNAKVILAALLHVNYRARGRSSDLDHRLVRDLAVRAKIPLITKKMRRNHAITAEGFESQARKARYGFFRKVCKERGIGRIFIAHNADDQVETVLMRILEGAGISGLKGIPRKTAGGIERPLLDTWREDILKYLRKHKISYRVDKSNFDTRFERNWVRRVLIPLLEKRYGKSVKKRIFTLGERFREIDEFLETAARRWMKRNVKGENPGGRGRTAEGAGREGRLQFQRKPYRELPSALRKKVLQIVCFERVGIAPNERLLESMDRLVVSGGPSTRLSIGKGAALLCRYEESIVRIPSGSAKRGDRERKEGGRVGAERPQPGLKCEEKGRISGRTLERLTKGERAAVFDADEVSAPFQVRPLRQGDRIRPFGLDAEKKVKEILIDRKVPREERWGRPAVCDAEGRILWIPGVVRSDIGAVTGFTRRTILLRNAMPANKTSRLLKRKTGL